MNTSENYNVQIFLTKISLYFTFSGVVVYEMLTGQYPFDVFDSSSTDKEYENKLNRKILKISVRVPVYFSVAANSVILGFLKKNPRNRLGCDSAGFFGVKSHKFYSAIDWRLVS